MTDDHRPKFIPQTVRGLLHAYTKNNVLSGAYVQTRDLFSTEGIAFERFAILGMKSKRNYESNFALSGAEKIDPLNPLFRVLSFPEGHEDRGVSILRQMAEEMVVPFLDSPTILELIFRQVAAKTGYPGEFPNFISEVGEEKLPLDRAIQSVEVWTSLGVITGYDYPEQLESWLRWSYSPFAELGFPDEIAADMEAKLGPRDQSVDDIVSETIEMFAEFCGEYYADMFFEFPFVGQAGFGPKLPHLFKSPI